MLKLRLVLEVTYDPHGVSERHLRSNLDLGIRRMIGDGALTGDSEAEVDEHSIRIETVEPSTETKVS